MQPVVVPSNRPPERFYLGGRRITDFRGEPPAGDREPEDWVGSTTAVFGQDPVGLTVLPDGQTLASKVLQDPGAWLGPEHVHAYGADTKLLVKLLDAGQRLPVHAHPHVSFANEHLGCAHGKAEAWFILQGGPVHLGLAEDVVPQRLRALVAEQDVEALLGLLHRVEVAPGDVVYVPPGVLHAIGEGVLLVELQEPEDLSILLEWRDFALDGARDGHLGLGFDRALQAVERDARSAVEIAELIQPAGFGDSVLPPAADAYFRLERRAVDGPVTVAPGFAILVVTDGDVSPDDGGLDLPRGTTAILPHASGPLALGGSGEALVCRPPSPSAR
ncbi:MAG TPA: class I mannose-6-phosphate isomerase [Euzebyales bacterium]|nr:class I mannose-6-phosphate isomerase [Euzebyales bacterium]